MFTNSDQLECRPNREGGKLLEVIPSDYDFRAFGGKDDIIILQFHTPDNECSEVRIVIPYANFVPFLDSLNGLRKEFDRSKKESRSKSN